jgi:hypothetical protein
MIKALQLLYPMNIITGMHAGTWNIGLSKNRLARRHSPASAIAKS